MSAQGFEILTLLLTSLVLAHFCFCRGLVEKNISKFYNVILILRTTIYKAADLQPIENGVLVVETNQISSNCQLHYFLPK